MTIHDEQHEQEQEPEEYNKNDGLHDVFNKILLTIKTMCYGFATAIALFLACSWFMYEVDGKPLSTYTSEVGSKLAKQLVDDGYFAGVKVLFTEDEYCHNNGKRHHGCISKDDQKKLDNLIERALFNGGPDGITK